MESDILQTPQETLTCFICQGIFMDPVLLRCGHNFCKACLILSSEDIGIPDLCPVCRQPSHWTFRNNITMRNLVSNVRENRLMKYLISEDHKCMIHKERKIKFCGEIRALLCQLCSDSLDHRGHTHCTIGVHICRQMVSNISKKNEWELEKGRLSTQQGDREMLVLILRNPLYSKSCHFLNREWGMTIKCKHSFTGT